MNRQAGTYTELAGAHHRARLLALLTAFLSSCEFKHLFWASDMFTDLWLALFEPIVSPCPRFDFALQLFSSARRG